MHVVTGIENKVHVNYATKEGTKIIEWKSKLRYSGSSCIV